MALICSAVITGADGVAADAGCACSAMDFRAPALHPARPAALCTGAMLFSTDFVAAALASASDVLTLP